MDSLIPEKRSWNMSRIRGKDTAPEIMVRSLFHKMGYRFRLNYQGLPGKPDFVLPKFKVAVFVHGCFWHRHEGCKYAYNPKSRIDFWINKFKKNVIRDRLVSEQLKSQGWNQLIIWECETKNPTRLSARIRKFFNARHYFSR